ncbi:phosphoglycolate phosphatase [Marinicauda sp. Alg238-R41]|uniref:phosphoglycolate phosphatase n=1 Tax=Marinicauda sp. Alg238-R41 TaxID=2993447 RepID=UPI0022E71351|nr:phosphoglycolate phosphatase [Marinicauda sp. Alg238-R41]
MMHFRPGQTAFTREHCTREAAQALRERIERYWNERGYEVRVDLVEAGFNPAMRSARTDVRSDMLNALPRRLAS